MDKQSWKDRVFSRTRIGLCLLTLCLSSFPCSSRVPYGYDSKSLDKRISWVWGQCEKEGTRDYDRNGVVNCCDYATHFCIKWRNNYSEEVRLCQQQTARMNHMYVQIRCTWGWWSVDPRYTIRGTHDMETVWPGKYSTQGDNPWGYWARYFMDYVNRGY